MTDSDLESKFMGLVDGVLDPTQARRLLDICWQIESQPSAASLATTARV